PPDRRFLLVGCRFERVVQVYRCRARVTTDWRHGSTRLANCFPTPATPQPWTVSGMLATSRGDCLLIRVLMNGSGSRTLATKPPTHHTHCSRLPDRRFRKSGKE